MSTGGLAQQQQVDCADCDCEHNQFGKCSSHTYQTDYAARATKANQININRVLLTCD